MNAAHIHLMVNHLPLFASLFGGALLAAGVLMRQRALSRAGLVLALLAAAGGVAAAQSGERAEDVVEGWSGVSESAIEEHEEAAEAAQAAAVVLGVLALGALAVPRARERAERWLTVASLLAAVAVFGFTARAANLGGEIRHPEISDGAAASTLSGTVDDDEHR